MLGIVLSCCGAARAEPGPKPGITFVGHATVLFQGSSATVLTDPFWADSILWGVTRSLAPAIPLSQLPSVDVVLVSHTHPDHFDSKAIQALNPKPIVVMPWGRGRSLKKKGFTVVDLEPWETWEHKGVKITAVPARHNAWHNLGYVVEMDGRKIYFTGDTKLFDDLSRLKEERIDLMLMPYGGTPVVGNIWSLPQAAEAVARVQPRFCMPIHWETMRSWLTGRPPTQPEIFFDQARAGAPDTRFLKVLPGESIAFSQLNP